MTNIRLKDLVQSIETLAPLSLQEDYDNAGLCLGNPDQLIEKALICLDIRPEIVDEAIEIGAQLIISHHPPIFQGVKKIDTASRFGIMLKKSMLHNIAWYAAHTNLDNTLEGVNSYLCQKLELQHPRCLRPIDPHVPDTGSGVIGDLKTPVPAETLLSRLKEWTRCPAIRHANLEGKRVKRVALCGGSGSFLMADAQRQGADVYISGDMKYHDFTNLSIHIGLMDIGHFESEQFTKELLYTYIKKIFPNFAVHLSSKEVSPISYY